MTDWEAWHEKYGDPDSALSHRLRAVQAYISQWLDETAPARVTVLSVCAGDGRDLLGVLAGRGDAARVRATLLEYDPRNAARARAAAQEAGLPGVTVACADAGASDSYAGAVPADLVLLCGVLGNITDTAVQRVIETLPQFCRPGAHVIWTRHRRDPDLTGQVRQWLAAAGFAEVSFTAPPDMHHTVGRHRFTGAPQQLVTGAHLFTFQR